MQKADVVPRVHRHLDAANQNVRNFQIADGCRGVRAL